MAPFQALIFDMDGLMIDSERLYFASQRRIAARWGKEVHDSLLWKLMGRKPIESMTIFVAELGLPESPERLLEERNTIMREKLRTDLQPMPGLFEILEEFHPLMRLAIATGAQQEFLDIVVDSLGIGRMFSIMQSSEGISQGKPDPEIYLTVCRRLSLEPGNCLVLEDAANGVLAARRAGCTVIAVPSVYSAGQDFSEAHARVKDLHAAADWIRNSGKVGESSRDLVQCPQR